MTLHTKAYRASLSFWSTAKHLAKPGISFHDNTNLFLIDLAGQKKGQVNFENHSANSMNAPLPPSLGDHNNNSLVEIRSWAPVQYWTSCWKQKQISRRSDKWSTRRNEPPGTPANHQNHGQQILQRLQDFSLFLQLPETSTGWRFCWGGFDTKQCRLYFQT